MDALQKGSGSINAYQGNLVGVQFLQCLDASAASAFALCGVDDLPGLIVALLDAIAGFAEVEDDADEDREATQIFEHFKKTPAAEAVGGPLPEPFDAPQRKEPAVLEVLFDDMPSAGRRVILRMIILSSPDAGDVTLSRVLSVRVCCRKKRYVNRRSKEAFIMTTSRLSLGWTKLIEEDSASVKAKRCII